MTFQLLFPQPRGGNNSGGAFSLEMAGEGASKLEINEQTLESFLTRKDDQALFGAISK